MSHKLLQPVLPAAIGRRVVRGRVDGLMEEAAGVVEKHLGRFF